MATKPAAANSAAMATLDEVKVTATRIVRDIAGVDHTERDERKRQKLFRYGTSGSRSQTGKDKQKRGVGAKGKKGRAIADRLVGSMFGSEL